MALDPVVPRSRRNILAAAAGGLAGLLVGTLARPEATDATTGTMVYGTSMDEGADQTTLTSSGPSTVLFQNTGTGIPVQGFASGGQAGVLGSNSPGGTGVLGESPKGNGVQGLSTTGTGVNGISTSGIGMIGTSTSSVGAIGGSAATDQPGLYGQSTGNNTGVVGISGTGFFSLPSPTPSKTGVYGYVAQDATAFGVKGESVGGTGTAGLSSTGTGVQGSSTSGSGVTGTSSTSSGVAGSSVSAIGVSGSSTASLQPAIRGFSDGANTGVFGFSRTFGLGTPPATPANTGVYGYAIEDPTAVGVKGESTAGTGVVGLATNGNGVVGQSSGSFVSGEGNGVKGVSVGGYGVFGSSSQSSALAGSSTATNLPAILGLSAGNNTGVLGYSGPGLPPSSPPTLTGVYGVSAGVGVEGESTAGTGVLGKSSSGVGLDGDSASGVGVVGRSTTGTAVLAYIGTAPRPTAPTGTAVFGAGDLGGYDLYAGGSGRLGLVQGPDVGSPGSPFVSAVGVLFVDAAADLWVCVVGGTPGQFRKLAGPATAGSLHPIVPARVYDSRIAGGPLAVSGMRTISIATATSGGTVVPADATAVAYNLTVAATVGAGWLGVVPAGATFGGTSSINWFGPGQTLANGGVVKLGGDRQCDIWIGGRAASSTQFIVDITGYYR